MRDMRCFSIVMLSAGVLGLGLVQAVGAAPPQAAPRESAAPIPRPPAGAMQPAGGVQSGQMPLPDLSLTSIVGGIQFTGTGSDGMPCGTIDIKPIFNNIGSAATGPFKVVWERSAAEQGPYAIACLACTHLATNLAPGAGMLLQPRTFDSCKLGKQWYRVRLDADNVVIELKEDNNVRKVHH